MISQRDVRAITSYVRRCSKADVPIGEEFRQNVELMIVPDDGTDARVTYANCVFATRLYEVVCGNADYESAIMRILRRSMR